MKKLITLAMLLLLLMIGCVNDSINQNDQQKVALIISTLDNPFFNELKSEIEIEFGKSGVEVLVLNSNNDTEQEREHMKYALTQNVDLVLLNPTDSALSSEAVFLANDQSIPVVTIDRNVDSGVIVTHIASDNYEGGRAVGEIIAETFEGKGQIFILEGILNTSANDERIAGLLDVLDLYSMTIAGRNTAGFNREIAYDIIKDVLNFEVEMDVIFAANDEMALGALDAVIEHNKNILIYGFDGTEEALKAIGDGFLTGTVAQQSDIMAQISLETVLSILDGQFKEPVIYVPVRVITLSN